MLGAFSHRGGQLLRAHHVKTRPTDSPSWLHRVHGRKTGRDAWRMTVTHKCISRQFPPLTARTRSGHSPEQASRGGEHDAIHYATQASMAVGRRDRQQCCRLWIIILQKFERTEDGVVRWPPASLSLSAFPTFSLHFQDLGLCLLGQGLKAHGTGRAGAKPISRHDNFNLHCCWRFVNHHWRL